MKKITFLALIMAILMFSAPPSIAAETLPIGVPVPMTGWAAGSGADYFKGIKMAIDEINAAGGLQGKQLEIIRFDSKGFEPEVVMQAADSDVTVSPSRYRPASRTVHAIRSGRRHLVRRARDEG